MCHNNNDVGDLVFDTAEIHLKFRTDRGFIKRTGTGLTERQHALLIIYLGNTKDSAVTGSDAIATRLLTMRGSIDVYLTWRKQVNGTLTTILAGTQLLLLLL